MMCSQHSAIILAETSRLHVSSSCKPRNFNLHVFMILRSICNNSPGNIVAGSHKILQTTTRSAKQIRASIVRTKDSDLRAMHKLEYKGQRPDSLLTTRIVPSLGFVNKSLLGANSSLIDSSLGILSALSRRLFNCLVTSSFLLSISIESSRDRISWTRWKCSFAS